MKKIFRLLVVLSVVLSSRGTAQVADRKFDTKSIQRLREGEILSDVSLQGPFLRR